LILERPHRHNAIVSRRRQSSSPSSSTSVIGPRTMNGPSRYAVTEGVERRMTERYPGARRG